MDADSFCLYVRRTGRHAQVTAEHVQRVLTGKRQNPNAERDCHRKFCRWGLSLPIPIQEVQHEVGKNLLTTNWVKVSHWLTYLLQRMPILLGIPGVSLREQCQTFWNLFQYEEPDHIVYQSGKDLSRCLPLNLYGDEGRGPKRAQYLEMSFETAFGVLPHPDHTCGCAAELQRVPSSAKPSSSMCGRDPGGCAGKLSTNLKGHSYLTKHLIFGLPSYLYKEHDEILQEHLRLLSVDMQKLYDSGVRIGEETFYGILIGIKGDMKFHSETVCQFVRCHSNLGKKNKLMMCPFCHAGAPSFPFEEVADQPAWADTLMASRPWEGNGPQLAFIPFDRFGRQETMFRLDLFHVMKVGLSRDVVGSLVVIYSRLGFFDYDEESRDFPDRLLRAHGSFKLFCLQQQKSPGLRSFTRSFMNCKTFSSTPWSNSKGSDTTLLLKWLLWFTGLMLSINHDGFDTFLKTAKKVIENILGLHHLCESHGLFLDRNCAQLLYIKMLTVARGYHLLACHALDFRMVGFGVKPKYHALKHLAFKVRQALLNGAPRILNPNYASCESNEDHVGKVSSLARKVSTRTIGRRVIQRYFLKSRALFSRHLRTYWKGTL